MTFEELLLALREHSNLISNETHAGRNTNLRVGLLGHKIAEILESLELFTKGKYLSKEHDDIAHGLITFLKGIIVEGNADISGKTTSYELLVQTLAQTHNLDVTNTATILNGILKGVLSSEEFNSGFLGSGFRLNKLNDRWTLELDDLIVRKTMQVFELIVQKIRYQGGQVLHSPAGGKITAITDGGSYWRCEHDSTDSFTTGAQVLCQNFKIGSEQQNPDGSTTLQGVSVKRYWRLVTSFGKGWFNLSKSDCEPGSSVPEVGDDVAVLGHRSDPDQQSAIMLVSAGTNSPYIAHYAGINSYSTTGKEVLREGNLSGIVDPDFGPLSGHGLYSSNAFLKGVLRVRSGKTVEEAIEERAGGLEEQIQEVRDKRALRIEKVYTPGYDTYREGQQDYQATLGLRVYFDDEDVTSTLNINRFTWMRVSENTAGDPTWNELHANAGATIDITMADLAGDTSFIVQFYDLATNQTYTETF